MSSAIRATLFLVLVIFGLAAKSRAEDGETTSPGPPSATPEERKLLLRCQHPDYRTYIKCLKRQKRHHLHADHDSENGETMKCFDECGMEHCESTKCVHDCHKRCMKKTKETRQIITQYETTCLSDDCETKSERSEIPTTNVTTNIDINNVINNHISSKTNDSHSGHGTGGSGYPPGGGPKPGPNWPGPGGPGPGGPGTNWPGPWTPGSYGPFGGLSLVPQIQFVPQITFGLGLQTFPYPPSYPPNDGVDCSRCSNPFFRYRCDTTCYVVQGSGSPVPIPQKIDHGHPSCVSPHCVGGT